MTHHQHPDVPLPSLRSLGLLDYRPSNEDQYGSQTLPPLRLLPGPFQDVGASINAMAWGENPMAHIEAPQGQQPPQNQNLDNPPLDVVPEAGIMTMGADFVLVPAGETHPHMAGEAGGQGGQGGSNFVVHSVDFIQVNGRTKMVTWVNSSA